MTRGLLFSQKVLLKLVEKGVSREDAYAIVQRNAMKSWKENMEFKQLLLDDSDVMTYLAREDIEDVFKIENYLIHLNHTFERVFGGNK
jgi:adenylosuccinate lyase